MSKPFKRSFKYRVQRRMEKEGWTVFPICDSDSPVDLVCFRGGKPLGLRVRAHGHIYQSERDNLRQLGDKAGMDISYVHEIEGREFSFVIIRRRR